MISSVLSKICGGMTSRFRLQPQGFYEYLKEVRVLREKNDAINDCSNHLLK